MASSSKRSRTEGGGAALAALEAQTAGIEELDLLPGEDVRLAVPRVALYLLDHCVGTGRLFITTA